jgi:hypothetical protein
MDRFVNGADVPENELRHVWQDTTVELSVPQVRQGFTDSFRLDCSLPPYDK